MQTGITEIVRTAWNSDSPAMVNVQTGKLFINTPVFSKLPFEQRYYVLLHEAGHATLKTRSEDLADEFASDRYIARGHSLKQSVFALTRVLNMKNPEHRRRANNQLQRAQQFDKQNNKNMNAVDRVLTQHGQFEEEPISDFLGIGKKARERREQRREDRQQHQLDKIAAGGGFGNTVKGIFQGIGSGLGGLLGGGGGSTAGAGTTDLSGGTGGTGGTDGTGDDTTAKKGMPTWAWILIGLTVIGLIIWFVMRRAKKKKG